MRMERSRVLNAGAWLDREGTDFIDLKRPPGRPEVKLCDLNSDAVPYKDGTFDRVICRQVLTHLYNPVHALSEFHRVLKKQGVLYLTVPNEKFHVLFSDSYKGKFAKEWDAINKRRESRSYVYLLYNMHNIRTLLERAGFTRISSEYGFVGYETIRLRVYKAFFGTLSLFSRPTFCPQIITNAIK